MTESLSFVGLLMTPAAATAATAARAFTKEETEREREGG